MLWKILVEIFTSLIPNKKLKYKYRRQLRSLWNYLYVKNKVAKFGKGVYISHNAKCSVSKKTYLDDYSSLGSCYIVGSGKFIFGKYSHAGDNLTVSTDNHNYNGTRIPFDDTVIAKDVIVEDFCWLGINVTLLPGTKIGEGAIIQAGSVVHGEIPPLAIAGGNPAKVFKYRDKEHFEKLKKEEMFF